MDAAILVLSASGRKFRSLQLKKKNATFRVLSTLCQEDRAIAFFSAEIFYIFFSMFPEDAKTFPPISGEASDKSGGNT